MQKLQNLRQEEYLAILESLHDGLYFVDRNCKITFWNKGAERISGFTAEEVVGRSCADSILTHMDAEGNYLCEQGCPLHATIADKGLREATVFMHHKDGHRIPVSVRTSPLLDERGNVRGGIEIFTDVSAQEANALRVKELEKLALLDQLTDLANRRYVEQEIESRLAEYDRFGVPFGILFMDIDFFKTFNDTHGHDVGDEVLQYVSKTFTRNSRPFDLYGRWGGEEFIAIIRNVTPGKLYNIAERLRLLVEGSYILHHEKKLRVTISIGATMAMVDDTIEGIVKRADEQLYSSKKTGRNRVTME
ncbi:MAG: diguanylate cyclase [Desulfopila sp.]